jgi:hypothetical protein
VRALHLGACTGAYLCMFEVRGGRSIEVEKLRRLSARAWVFTHVCSKSEKPVAEE